MLSVIVSSTIVQIVNKGSYHVKKLEKQGFRLTGGKEASILKSISVEDVIRTNPILVHENASLQTVVSKLMESKQHIIYTIDDNGNLIGSITETHIRPLITEFDSVKESLIASDIANNKVVTITKSHDLDYALKILTKADIDEIPVVADDNDKKVIGIISHQDILSAYNKESLKADLAEGLSREISTLHKNKISHIADGYAIVECKPNNEFIGKTLAQLKMRNTFGLEATDDQKS